MPVRTFTIGFEEEGFNEVNDAKRVAAHLGTVHCENYVTVKEALEVISQLPAMYDEPFRQLADPDFPSLLVRPRTGHRGADRRRRR